MSDPARKTRRWGFTLIELLVVMGILVVLIGILVPTFSVARRKAKVAAIGQTIQVISTGLQAYQQDFSGYPEVAAANTGFAVLGQALVGPGGTYKDAAGKIVPPSAPIAKPSAPVFVPTETYKAGACVCNGAAPEFLAIRDVAPLTGTSSIDYWTTISYSDGHDGFGYAGPPGKTGPYLNAESVRMRGLAILDAEDNPIAYFKARNAKNNIHLPIPSASLTPIGSYVDRSTQSQYNADQNLALFLWPQTSSSPSEMLSVTLDVNKVVMRIRTMLGDISFAVPPPSTIGNGVIDIGEQPATDLPFLLWSAGPDGLFGPNLSDTTSVPPRPTKSDLTKCDDVTNFK